MSDELEQEFAADLAAAHRRLRVLEISEDEKALASKRLVAIADASKHDVKRAAMRLSDFMNDLDEGRTTSLRRPREG